MKALFGSMFGITGMIFLVIGCPFTAVAAGAFYFTQYSTRDWVLVKGTVTDMTGSSSYDTDNGGYTTSYCPTVKFQTANGEDVEEDSNECSSPAAYSTGDTVELYYNPQNPHDIQLKGGALSTVGVIFEVVFGILGVLSCLAGGVLVVAAIGAVVWRTKPTSPPLGY